MPDQPVGPLLLALDTTHEFGSLALARGGRILEEVLLHSPSGFSHVLFPALAGLLARHGLRVSQVAAFAAASGPGSFTGVRVGLACVMGLAEAARRPAFAVSNLQAVSTFARAPLRAAVLDARRGEIYGAVYDASARLVQPEVVAKADAWLETLPASGLDLVSPDFAPLEAALSFSRFAAPRVVAPRAIAAAIARLALARLCSGDAPDPASLDANYVRRSDAELFWKD